MNPAALRDLDFAQLRASLASARLEVYDAFVRFGPCTTRRLADLCGLDILSVRPRATELYQIGLLADCGTHKSYGSKKIVETIFRVTTPAEFETARQARQDGQLALI